MSKVEVKVKDGDRWCTDNNTLYQLRSISLQRKVADHRSVDVKDWSFQTYTSSLPDAAARAWIESLGGTVVEEREEEKAVKWAAHLVTIDDEDGQQSGDIVLSAEGSAMCNARDAASHEFRRVPWPGVTT